MLDQKDENKRKECYDGKMLQYKREKENFGAVKKVIEKEKYSGQKQAKDVADYSTLDMNSQLIMNLRDLGHVIRFLFEGKSSQKRVLIILSEVGKITQRDLTKRLGVQPASASEVIGKLENAGMIERTPNLMDFRTMDICLTDEGRKEAEKAVRERTMRHQEMFSCLSAEEKKTMLKLAQKLNEDWVERYREGK
ncbi:MAG: MarR family transcriptional regulator [Robinsoniella sp.]|nr:MarR family transcriptional regulator [Robinsoniella sp.]